MWKRIISKSRFLSFTSTYSNWPIETAYNNSNLVQVKRWLSSILFCSDFSYSYDDDDDDDA